MNATPREQAKQLAKHGRFGDKRLLHVNDEELDFLSRAGKLHENPITGLPEAWSPFHGDFGLGDSFTNVRDTVESGFGGSAIAGPVGSFGGMAFDRMHPDSPFSQGLETLGGGIMAAGATELAFPGTPSSAGGIDTGAGESFGMTGFEGDSEAAMLDAARAGSVASLSAADIGFGGAGAASSGILGTGITPMGAFLGLNAISSGYGMYEAYQLQKQRKQQLYRQKEYQNKLNALFANPSSFPSTPCLEFVL